MEAELPHVSVLILNWNRKEVTLECLASFSECRYPNKELVLIDQASQDGTVEAVRERFPRVRIIQNRENLGFPGGFNAGIRKMLRDETDFFLISNNDVVVAPDLLDEMVGAARANPQAGVLGPKIYYFDTPDVIWWAGSHRYRLHKRYSYMVNFSQEGKGEKDRGQFDEPKRVDSVIGCVMLIRKEVFQRAGLFDERYFSYNEEHDFCRAVSRNGFKLRYVPSARVWHKVSTSWGGDYSPGKFFLWTRNWLLLTRKEALFPVWPLLYYEYIREALWIFQGLVEGGQPSAARASIKGALAALANRFGPPPKDLYCNDRLFRYLCRFFWGKLPEAHGGL